MSAMLRAIDSDRLEDRRVSEQMWSLLRDQRIVDRIPAGLPKNAGLQVGNKTGTMLSVVHDAAIVRGKGLRYLLVIMIDRPTDEDPGPEGRPSADGHPPLQPRGGEHTRHAEARRAPSGQDGRPNRCRLRAPPGPRPG